MGDPAERVLRAHLEDGPFLSGAAKGRWRLVAVEWPYAHIAVAAAVRAGAPSEYELRFDCGGYPQRPPTAQPWDGALNAPLAPPRWPTGRGRVLPAFNPAWKAGACLYLPCDRQSIEGHDNWRTQHPSLLWSPAGDITQYLRIVHDLLHSDDYTGLKG
jgi:hypothetical protein